MSFWLTSAMAGPRRQNNAKVKQLFKIDLAGAVDVGGMDGLTAAGTAVSKNLFLDIVNALTPNLSAGLISAKIEGLSCGSDVNWNGNMVIRSGWPTTTIS